MTGTTAETASAHGTPIPTTVAPQVLLVIISKH